MRSSRGTPICGRRHNGNGSEHDAAEPVRRQDRRIPVAVAPARLGALLRCAGSSGQGLAGCACRTRLPGRRQGWHLRRLTRAAVLAFQADNGLVTSGEVDQQTWKAMSTAAPRPLSRERKSDTPKELERLGSTIVADGLRTKGLGWITGILGMLGLTTGMAVDLGSSDPKRPPIHSRRGHAHPRKARLNCRKHGPREKRGGRQRSR